MNKIKLLQLFFLLPLLNYGQITVDTAVRKKYETLSNKLNLSAKQSLWELQEKEPGLGICILTLSKVDTLNKEDIINDKSVIVIEDIDPNGSNKPEKNISELDGVPLLATAILNNDTLVLGIGGFFLEGISHKIYLGQVTSYYGEYNKYDSIFRLQLTDPKASKLSVPSNTKVFVINSPKYKYGDIIYGEVEFETSPYYVDTYGFKHNYIKKRLRCNYVFKVRVGKNISYH